MKNSEGTGLRTIIAIARHDSSIFLAQTVATFPGSDTKLSHQFATLSDMFNAGDKVAVVENGKVLCKDVVEASGKVYVILRDGSVYLPNGRSVWAQRRIRVVRS